MDGGVVMAKSQLIALYESFAYSDERPQMRNNQ